jgi:hypothetical protein
LIFLVVLASALDGFCFLEVFVFFLVLVLEEAATPSLFL